MGIREDFMEKLVEVTKKLNRQVTASEFLEAKQDDKSLPDPNDYAFYWKDFDHAAKQAYIEGTPWPKGDKEVDVMRRIRPCALSKAKQETIIAELVDMFIENNGIMPSNRQIKHNKLIKETEVNDMRWSGLIEEPYIRKLAEEKSGRTFLSPTERRNQQKAAAAPEVTPEEVKKVNEETRLKQRQRRHIRKTNEELWAEIRKKCAEAGHILTDAEINADETLSAPQTYYNHLGKGYRSAIYLEKAPTPVEVIEEKPTPKITEEVPTPEEIEEPKVEPKPKVEVKPEVKVEPVTEVKPKREMAEIPFRLIVPKGIKGTITLNLEF